MQGGVLTLYFLKSCSLLLIVNFQNFARKFKYLPLLIEDPLYIVLLKAK